MAGTQEVDGLMKKLCQLIRPGSNPQSIKHYRDIIKVDLPIINEEIIKIPRFGMSSIPWLNWQSNDDNNSPEWWIANNNIKHNRTENFEQANLKNAFNCVGALLMITLYYYKLKMESEQNQSINWTDITSILKPKAILFTLKDDYYHEPGTWAVTDW
jgi:hypothetical protein